MVINMENKSRLIIISLCTVILALVAVIIILVNNSQANPPPDTQSALATTSTLAVTQAAAGITQVGEELPTLQTRTTTSTYIDNTISVSETVEDSWQDGDYTCTKIRTELRNHGDTVDSWSVEITLSEDCEVLQFWNAILKKEGNILTISNESYNGTLKKDEMAECGYILRSKGEPFAAAEEFSAAITAATTASTAAAVTTTAAATSAADVKANSPATNTAGENGDDWLYTKGNKIVDSSGKEVWITGINWFGYNTGTNTFDGLWAANLEQTIEGISDRGFNLLRIPMSVELVSAWRKGSYPAANFNNSTNSGLVGKNSLEIFDHVISVCKQNGLKVMLDIHSAKSDPMGHMANSWYTNDSDTEEFYNTLEWLADRYKNDDTVLMIDLKNEPHGKPNEPDRAEWNDTNSKNNWKKVAETAASKVLRKNPNLLVVIEGVEIYPKDIAKNGDYSSTNGGDYYFTWWGGNLRGVADYPINLGQYQNKVVYSPHDYGPAVYQQPWFRAGYSYESLMNDCWRDNWFYIYENGTAPLLIGEWGGYMTEPNLTWMTHLRTLIKNYQLHHTFWCYNANSGDTGGLVKDDFLTWDEEKYAFVKEALWQKNGKFVGLDHKIPLGKNGITLSEY